MTRHILSAAVLAGAALLLAACDGTTIAEPGAPRLAICWESRECGPDPRDPVDTTTQPPPQPVASFKAYSSGRASALSPYKFLDAWSVNENVANVASSTLTASFSHEFHCDSRTRYAYQTRSAAAYGSPKTVSVSSSWRYNALDTYRFRTEATHTFTPVAGATGGGTVTSWWSKCY